MATPKPKSKELSKSWASLSPKKAFKISKTYQKKLDFYKRQPLASDWFAIFIDTYWENLETQNPATSKTSPSILLWILISKVLNMSLVSGF